jgi:acrylyl-CoA reductase (NADPH)/3-hydroxypropionyl-CoA dehydratase/3-hydroxypropionyl-CoA synthetase
MTEVRAIDGESVAPLPPQNNTIVDKASWQAMRAACLADPGQFHGDLAKRHICWFLPDQAENGVWAFFDDQADAWTGWDAKTGAPVALDLPAEFEPWDHALKTDDAPNWRWFEGGLTNAAFNEVDRHVLAGHGDEAALIFEGDRWNMSSNDGRGGPVDEFTVSRKQLCWKA